MSTQRQRNIIAVDVGYGNTKMVCGHELDKSGRHRWIESVFPSVTPIVAVDEDAIGFKNADRIMIELKGQRYYAGPKASSGFVPRVIEDQYIESDTHEVLLRAAIHIAMRESKRVITRIDKLLLGLPVSGFSTGRERLGEIAMTPRQVPVPKSLLKDGQPSVVNVTVDDCIVYPQPYGALRLAAQGLPTEDPIFKPGQISMVVDPGYRTLDWFVAEAMAPDMMLSGSYDGGVSSVLREIGQLIGYEQGTGSLDFDLVELGLKTGKINLGHKVIDMEKYQKMIPHFSGKEIGAFVTRLGYRRSNIARVFIAGGGASYYEHAIKTHLSGCEVTTMADPVMSNARGYWLAGCDAMDD